MAIFFSYRNLGIYIYKVVIFVCPSVFVCPIITPEPLTGFPEILIVTLATHRNVLSLVLRF